MPETIVTLIKGDKHGSEVDYRDAIPINMYAVNREILGAKGYLISYPGLVSFGTGSGIDRGGIYNEQLATHYRVSGTKLISVSTSGIKTELGDISGTDQVAMPYSHTTQCIIADGKMFLDNGGFAEVVDGDLGNPIDGVWVNGYYFLTDGEYIYHTNITDETAIDPLKFATAEFMPDPTLGVLKTQDNKVAVFGRYTIEYFTDIAQANFAFTRIEARAQKIGIVATHAKCELGGNFYIVGGSKNEDIGVHVIKASSSQKISTREIDKRLGAYKESELSDIRVECRKEDDITFVVIHLPNETLVFNESIAMSHGISIAWSEIKSDVSGDINFRGINNIFDPRIPAWICGDKQDSRLGILDALVATHYEAQVEWIFYTPFIRLETTSIDKLEIDTISGFSNSIESVAISLTYDGVIYGTEYWMNYSVIGTYDTRFIVRRLGYISDWVGFKFRGASTAKMAFALMKLVYS